MSGRSHRERQIAEVLARHGMSHLVGVLGLERLRGVAGRAPQQEPYSSPRELRLALEELGPTFIKLGQIVSTRGDLLGPEYRSELAKLQDAGPSVPGAEIRAVVEREVGGDVEGAFASFEPEPLAAASIGQAHAATLHDGTEVVVKIRRPGVVEEVQQDLEILQNLAARAARLWEPAAQLDLVGVTDEFARQLRAELDYLAEGRNAERFARNFADQPDAQIPRVFWETTTSRIITLERMRGMKVTDFAALEGAGVDRRALAERATRITAKMVFDDGFFHADPHPGNFFVQPTGRLGIIDFGMVGTLDDRMRERLGTLLVAVMRDDPDRMAGALIALGTSTGPVDRARLRDDLAGLTARYGGRAVGEVELGAAIAALMDVVRRHRLRIPRDLALLVKVIAMEEGVAEQLDPDFRIGEALAPYARRQLLAQLAPTALGQRLERLGIDLAELAGDLPEQLRRALEVVAGGGFEVHLRAAELEPLMARAERLGNRIAVSVLAAAIIDGLAELAAAERASRNGRARPTRPGRLAAVGALGAYVALRSAAPALARRRSSSR
jgi:ubiquinone biosynthesis protein